MPILQQFHVHPRFKNLSRVRKSFPIFRRGKRRGKSELETRKRFNDLERILETNSLTFWAGVNNHVVLWIKTLKEESY